jgi:hypothetical protein
MSSAITSRSALPPPSPEPPLLRAQPPAFWAKPPAVPKAMPPHVRPDSVASAPERLIEQNATNIADFAAGAAAAPHAIVQAYEDAAKANGALADNVEKTLANWSTQTISERQSAIKDLAKLAKGERTLGERLAGGAHGDSAGARLLADQLDSANQAARFLDGVKAPLDAIARSAGRSAGATVDRAVAAAPGVLRGPLGTLASKAKAAVGSAYNNWSSSADKAINALPPAIRSDGTDLAVKLRSAAKADTAIAEAAGKSLVRKGADIIGASVGDFTKVGSSEAASAETLSKGLLKNGVGVLRDVPLVGAALTVASTAVDVASGKSVADASVANVAGTVAGDVVTNVAGDAAAAAGIGTDAAAAGAGLGIGEIAADAAVVAATGPVGLAAVGAVALGVGASYLATKALESKTGQAIINGAAHDAATVGKDIGKGAVAAAHEVSDLIASIF